MKKGRPTKKVINTLTGKVYSSIKEAEELTGIRHLSEVCNNHRLSAGGTWWRYYND